MKNKKELYKSINDAINDEGTPLETKELLIKVNEELKSSKSKAEYIKIILKIIEIITISSKFF